MDEANDQLVGAVRDALAHAANPLKAPAMQAYMKSAMPFLGVPAPDQRRVYRQVFATHPLADVAEWQATVLTLWREAHFREERYAAVALTGDRRYRAFQRPDILPLYEELVVTGAWWDLVDEVAIHRVGDLLLREPDALRPALLAWARDGDKWKRRTSILSQNAHKDATDEHLLFACIVPNLADHDFFVRKAIGWALREYAKANPMAVRRFVVEYTSALSPLSRREALKHLTPD